jgi:hypothetical protein
MGRALRRAGLAALLAFVIWAPSAAQQPSTTWAAGEWHGRLYAVAALTGPDGITLGPALVTDFEFRLTVTGGLSGTMADFGGSYTVDLDPQGTFTVDATFSGCSLSGDALDLRFACDVVLRNTYDIGSARIPWENRFSTGPAPLNPTAAWCTQAYGSRALVDVPVPGTELLSSVDARWHAVRTETADAADMVETINGAMDDANEALAAGDVGFALDVIREIVAVLPNLGNAVQKAETCSAGTAAGRDQLWGWLHWLISRTAYLALERQGLLETSVLIDALAMSAWAGQVGGAGDADAAARKASFEAALGTKLDRAIPRTDPSLSEQVRRQAENEIRAIGVAATQFGMPELYARVPGDYR